jgi:hypothetical protein
VRWARLAVCLSVGLLVDGSHAQAQDDPLLAVTDADPLELARAAARLGDAAVLARLADARPRELRLAAIRATPFLHAPERALAPLAAIAGGRDSVLAPAAALAGLRIARTLDGLALDRRECAPTELHDARTAWDHVARDETARADIRRAAESAVAALSALGVP